MKIEPRKRSLGNFPGFTLIELLVVISIIGLLAGMSFPVIKSVKAAQQKRVARGELEVIQTALENYKTKYGTYPPGNSASAILPQLYYELAGVSFNSGTKVYTTLDGRYTITESSYNDAYGVGGVVNCSKGSGEDGISAKNFLPSLKQNQTAVVTNNSWNKQVFPTTALITSVGGPDQAYQPLGGEDINPIRYRYPGVNNPNSYDLWIQLRIGGKTNLICNWSRQVTINSPLP